MSRGEFRPKWIPLPDDPRRRKTWGEEKDLIFKDHDEPLPPLPEFTSICGKTVTMQEYRKKHGVYRSYPDPEENFLSPDGQIYQKFNPELGIEESRFVSPATPIILALTGYKHTEVIETKVQIYAENPDTVWKREHPEERPSGGSSGREYIPIDYSHRNHTAVRFIGSTGNPGVFATQVELCCVEPLSSDIPGADWYFRYNRIGDGFNYYLIDEELAHVVLISLKNIQKRSREPEWERSYDHISGWEHLDRLLELANISVDEFETCFPAHVPCRTEFPSVYLLWALFNLKWTGEYPISVSYLNGDDDDVSIVFESGNTLTIQVNESDCGGYSHMMRHAIQEHIAVE